MFENVFNRSKPGICQLVYEAHDGRRLSTGTGFLFDGKLVTCCHVAHGAAPNGKVRIKFGAFDAVESTFAVEEMSDHLVAHSPRDKKDLAVYDASFFPRADELSFTVPQVRPVQVFDEVAVLGYPFGDPELTGHRARISRFWAADGVETMQLEGSVNVGNSGGPVLTLQEGAVIGVVVRKQPGLSSAFERMRTNINEEIKDLASRKLRGSPKALRDSLVRTQNAMMVLSDEVMRSSNTGIGYAVSVAEVIRLMNGEK